MRLRFSSAIGMAAVITSSIFFSGCQNSGPALALAAARFSNLTFHQKFPSLVPANTNFDQYDAFAPVEIDFGQAIIVSGTIKPPTPTTLPSMMTIQPFVVCPGTTKMLPTTPPILTIPVNQTNGSFSTKSTMLFPNCPSGTGTINKIIKKEYFELWNRFDIDVPANTQISATLSAN